MSEAAWDRFVEHVRGVLKRPRFDEGYRDWKPGFAVDVRRLLEVERDPERWIAGLDSVVPAREDFRDPRYDRPTPRQANWMKRWARIDAPSLWKALGDFATAGEDPLARFSAFAKSAEMVPADVRVSADGIVVMGAVFNFSLAPESLPLLRTVSFARVEHALGFDPKWEASLVEQYESHVDFAGVVKQRLEDERVPIRDMIDLQSLIFIAGYEHEFWAVEEPAEVRAKRERAHSAAAQKPYLSICAIYKDEAQYLPEWIEFHRLVGVERFFLYDNRSTDNHLEVLSPYVEDGTVVLNDWPLYPGQVQAYNHCLEEHRHDSRWIAFLDLDEYLFSPTGLPLSDVLPDYERFPGVAVNWLMFGTSGLRDTAPGLVIETHLQRGREAWQYIKHIVDPARVVRCNTIHAFAYDFQTAVDENGVPIIFKAGRTQFTSTSRLRINHYYLKSEAVARAKLATPKPDGGGPREYDFDTLDRELNEERDEEILRYAPAVRAALEKGEQQRGKLGSRTSP